MRRRVSPARSAPRSKTCSRTAWLGASSTACAWRPAHAAPPPVTKERRKQESEGHICSICSEGLDLEACEQDIVVATSAPDEERAAATAVVLLDAADDDEDRIDAEEALQQAEQHAHARVASLEDALRQRSQVRDEALSAARITQDEASVMEQRRGAELELARAQGAAEAFAPMGSTTDVASERERLVRHRTVLRRALSITEKWVHAEQKDPLVAVSDEVTQLTRDFGLEQLEGVKVGGGATMTVYKGSAESAYGSCVPTEQVRLKVATALALLRAGFDTGVGRHPGLLLIDSPCTEEEYKDNLDTMIGALRDAIGESPNIQVIVATTASGILNDFIPTENRRVAPAGGYVR